MNVFVGLLIAGRAAALGADLDDFPGLLHRGPEGPGVLHGVGGRLLHVGIASRLHCFDTMQGMLKIGGGDDDRIDVFAGIELVVVTHAGDGTAALLLDKGRAFIAAPVPDVGDGDKLEVELLGVLLEGGHQGALGSITGADQCYPDAIVGAHDGGVAVRSPGNDRAGERSATYLQEIPAVLVLDNHGQTSLSSSQRVYRDGLTVVIRADRIAGRVGL